MKYARITAAGGCHQGHVWTMGLNQTTQLKRHPGKYGPGLYFTTAEQVHQYYDYGDVIMVLSLPGDAVVVRNDDISWRADKVVVEVAYDIDRDVVEYTRSLGIAAPSVSQATARGWAVVLEYHRSRDETKMARWATKMLGTGISSGKPSSVLWWLDLAESLGHELPDARSLPCGSFAVYAALAERLWRCERWRPRAVDVLLAMVGKVATFDTDSVRKHVRSRLSYRDVVAARAG